jgi:ABC-2 type transport system ATP-binding protein
MLQFKNFKKLYGGFPALRIDELAIDPGIYWIKGVNGSGKSTLLKSIAGILSFDGDILLDDDISIKKQPVAYRQLVNFAEAEPVFPEFLTGKEMIALFMQAKGAPAGQEQHYLDTMQMQPTLGSRWGHTPAGCLKSYHWCWPFWVSPN